MPAPPRAPAARLNAGLRTLAESAAGGGPEVVVTGGFPEPWAQPVNGRRFVIGRTPGCQLYLNHPRISREHAEITAQDGRYFITDLGSRNGTYLNDQRLGSGRRRLRDGDEIRLGAQVALLFRGAEAGRH